MTGDITLFHKNTPSPVTKYTVRIADGTLSQVEGIGSVMVSGSINLEHVLYVPNLNCNLLSVSKLTKERNCIAKFSSNLCKVQESDSEKRIGSAKMCSGLYLLQVEDVQLSQSGPKPCSALNQPCCGIID